MKNVESSNFMLFVIKNGIFHSYDFSPAGVHDVNYLNDVKNDFKNCVLIGDRGYVSKELQVDLFNYSNIKLSVPKRKNQHDFVAFSKTKSKIRKRIETAISQLNGQFLIHINLAKTFQGLATRIASKITSFYNDSIFKLFRIQKKSKQN